MGPRFIGRSRVRLGPYRPVLVSNQIQHSGLKTATVLSGKKLSRRNTVRLVAHFSLPHADRSADPGRLAAGRPGHLRVLPAAHKIRGPATQPLAAQQRVERGRSVQSRVRNIQHLVEISVLFARRAELRLGERDRQHDTHNADGLTEIRGHIGDVHGRPDRKGTYYSYLL